MGESKYLLALLAGIICLAFAYAFARSASAPESNQMKKSKTYLHLLRKTPFFTKLDKAQLTWVIHHSTEWEAHTGTEISNRDNAAEYMWILLDGGWQVEQACAIFKSGHADPAKWYGARALNYLSPDSKLFANTHTYVMRIKRTDFDEMLDKKFDFNQHLAEGDRFYSKAALIN